MKSRAEGVDKVAGCSAVDEVLVTAELREEAVEETSALCSFEKCYRIGDTLSFFFFKQKQGQSTWCQYCLLKNKQ